MSDASTTAYGMADRQLEVSVTAAGLAPGSWLMNDHVTLHTAAEARLLEEVGVSGWAGVLSWPDLTTVTVCVVPASCFSNRPP